MLENKDPQLMLMLLWLKWDLRRQTCQQYSRPSPCLLQSPPGRTEEGAAGRQNRGNPAASPGSSSLSVNTKYRALCCVEHNNHNHNCSLSFITQISYKNYIYISTQFRVQRTTDLGQTEPSISVPFLFQHNSQNFNTFWLLKSSKS